MAPLVNNVRVVNLNRFTRERTITWDPSTDVAVGGYNIYRSEVSYADFEKLNTDIITTTSYVDKPPTTPIQPFQWWYKVTAVDNNGETDLALSYPAVDLDINTFNESPFIQEEPKAYSEQNATHPRDGNKFQTLPNTKVNPRWFLEIRKRHRWLLEMGGKDVYLLKRRWTGPLCPLWDPLRRQHEQMTGANHEDPCYGTGIMGGYHTPYRITVSFVSPASKKTVINVYGMHFEIEPSSWTLWEPNLVDRDIIVRPDTNERFEILNVTKTQWRGLVMHQNFDVRLLEPTSIAYKIPVPLR